MSDCRCRLLYFLLLALLAACSNTEPLTQVMVVLDADAEAAASVAALSINVSGRSPGEATYEAAPSKRLEVKSTDWPLEFALVPKGQDATRQYVIEVTALDSQSVILTVVRAQGSYLAGKVALLPLLLDGPCVSTRRACDAGQTCTDGECKSAWVDPKMLADYTPRTGNRTPSGSGGVATSESGSTVDQTGGDVPSATGGVVAEPTNPCAIDNGGCSEDEGCSMQDELVMCEPCLGEAASSDACAPRLTELTPSAGALSPPFDPYTLEYSLRLPLGQRALSVQAVAPAGVQLWHQGQALSGPLALVELPYGTSEVLLVLKADSGGQRTYRVVLQRSGEQNGFLKASNAEATDLFGVDVEVWGESVVVAASAEDSAARIVFQPMTSQAGSPASDPRADNLAPDSGAVYVFDADAQGVFQETAYIKPTDTGLASAFGSSLAADGATLMVGAVYGGVSTGVTPLDFSGAAYIFVRDTSGIRQQQKLVPSRPASLDWFGVALDVEGDVAVVGAPDQPLGLVYVYERKGERWSEVQVIEQPTPHSGARFGAALQLAGGRLLIGAPNDSRDADALGAAYVLDRGSNGRFEFKEELRPSKATPGDNFGFSVQGLGDRVLVGAPEFGDTVPGKVRVGYVSVFDLAGTGGTVEQQRLTPPSGRTLSLFGTTMALLDNGALYVGAQGEQDSGSGFGVPGADTDKSGSGGIYVYGLYGGSFALDTYIKASNPDADDNFGFQVAASKDLLVAGAFKEASGAASDGTPGDNRLEQSGAAYLFR